MVVRSASVNRFEFVIVSALRAQQLLAGSVPRLPGDHGAATMAQMEVAGGQVARTDDDGGTQPAQCRWQL